jgi:RNA polymerase sigma-70 factor (ECF subfamily)
LTDNINQNIDFKNLVENLQEKVRNTCFRYVNSIEDADDIAQDVFVQVYESMSHFREESQLSTWVYRIAVNKSLDFLRSKKRKKRFGQITSLFKSNGEDEEIIEIFFKDKIIEGISQVEKEFKSIVEN